ncbi:hypothetical protein [Spiroplasma endosymbiont of 'Nebria riversi']|uniref:hypothetical protein n=1 Tax=Spiroplasma endosymbiont of 'Nebria riversi' TaxID=2792084 RepID=UPI001C043A46|nr:hypothetical protein [Spiroplasma endosymbiont of 'Nebria riversi']
MKKLLSLLSTITTASSGIAGIVANSPYPTQEQQIKLENINYKRQTRSNDQNNKINRTKIIIKTNGIIYSSGIVFNDKLYFGSDDNNVYEYNPVTGQQKIVMTTNAWTASSGAILNNKLYIGSSDKNVYEYSNYDLNSNLGKISNNFDNIILSELNYLNPDLDISQL